MEGDAPAGFQAEKQVLTPFDVHSGRGASDNHSAAETAASSPHNEHFDWDAYVTFPDVVFRRGIRTPLAG